MAIEARRSPGRPIPAGDTQAMELRLALPAARSGVAVRVLRGSAGPEQACVVYLHGGYFSDGSMDDAMPFARALASAATVVLVDYPLAPASIFPVALETCFAVLEWTARNARRLKIDPLRLHVGGDQAGGNLASSLAMVARDRLFGRCGRRRVAGQILITPLLDSTRTTSPLRMDPSHPIHQAWSKYLSRPSDFHHPYASPLWSRRLQGLPPALIVTAGGHPLQAEAELYTAQLRKAGVQVQSFKNSVKSETPTAVHDHGFAATTATVQAFLRASASRQPKA